MDLKFTIENQILLRKDKSVIVNKSIDYVICHFKFLSEDWRDIEKFAIFKSERGEAYNVNLGTGCDCSCMPPADVLNGSFFRVSVYGGNRITTTEKTVVLLESGYTSDIKNPSADEVDVFTQIYDTLNKKIEDITFDDGSLKLYVDNKLVKVIPAENITAGLIQSFSDELSEALQDYVRLDEINFSDGILNFKNE